MKRTARIKSAWELQREEQHRVAVEQQKSFDGLDPIVKQDLVDAAHGAAHGEDADRLLDRWNWTTERLRRTVAEGQTAVENFSADLVKDAVYALEWSQKM